MNAAAHVSRNFKGVRLGGFAAFQNNEMFDVVTLGAEAQKTFDRATLTGSVGYSDFLQATSWNAGVDAAFYPMPALRLNAGANYETIDSLFGGSDKVDSWTYGIGAEYRVAATPYSVFGRYETTSYDDFDLDIDTFKIGVRYNFGGSLQDQDRAGANIGRATRVPAAILGFGAP
jgi:opacity protein-like surface antigen